MEFERNKVANKTFGLVWLASTAIFATLLNDWHFRDDENYNLFNKVPKML